VKPINDLHVRLGRISRHVLSARSAHTPAACVKLAPLTVLAVALAALGGVLHAATGARAMVAAPVAAATSPVSGPTAAPSAPVHLRIGVGRRNLNVLEGRAMEVGGWIRPALAHQRVLLQIRRGGNWHTVAHARTGVRGRFHLRYVPAEASTIAVRVAARKATRRVGLLNVYREAYASYYGGGGSLACGGELTSSTLGVANKTLPCGTLVTLRYGARSVRVPVIDRGPFVPGREFDLTEATKAALGFPGLGDVWSNR
jgi:hypothetical protein